MENFVPLLFYFLMLILSEQLLLKSHRCHQGGKRVHKSGFKGFCFWTPTCKSCFVSIRNSTFLLYFSLQKQLMLYLVQFLEELSICPKRGRKDLHNVLWHGVESCEEVEFHASHSKETYGNSQFRELEDCSRFQSHLWHLNFRYINITFVLRLKYKQMKVLFPCSGWGNCPFVSLCSTSLMF